MSRRAPVIHRESTELKPVHAEIRALERGYRDLIPWLALFAGSGCAALIYEIVWFQLLQLVIGASAISLGLLLAAYMGGLCLGSVLLPRLVSARRHPMRVYALLELCVAVCGIIALFAVPLVGRIYVAGAATGMAGLVLRGVVAAVCLLPPALLMGASLPAISRWVEATPRGVSWLGFLYSANVAGAVAGCVLAGFYLLRVHDMAVATYAAAAINITVALVALALAARDRRWTGTDRESKSVERAPGAAFIYLTIALSGLTALGAEVVWTRLLSLLLGATVYTFSIILAVFLAGLWAGSSAGSFLARRVSDARWALAVCQILLAASIAWTAFAIAQLLPWWPVDPWLALNPWINFDLDLIRCMHAVFLPTLFWGASFPLALSAAAARKDDPARLTGEVYAANTAGSIMGALAFSLILIPTLGTRLSQQVLIWLAGVAALVALASVVRVTSRISGAIVGAAACAVVIAGGLSSTVSSIPWQAIAYGRRVAPILRGLSRANDAETKPVFVGEGMNSSVVITQRGDQRFFYVSGKAEASSALIDMRLQRMMGHLPALIHPAPRSVLVVGFGAGVTAGSFVPYREVRSIDICELEPIIPLASDEYFGKENSHVLRDPRTQLISDDARHYILTTPKKFDVITTDPIHSWVKGTSTLYSKQYYELVKKHLNPGGVVAQWLPIYESDENTVKSEFATFFSVFPNATVWSNYLDGDGYDLVLIGSVKPVSINIDDIQRRLNRTEYVDVARSLREAEFRSGLDLFSTYAGKASDLSSLLANAQMNDDLNLRLQYIAGLGLNSVSAPQMYRDILSYRKFPDGLFLGTQDSVEKLHEVLDRTQRTF